MIISLDAEKAFDKIKHPFMMKALERVGIQGTFPKHNKGNLQQANSQHQIKLKAIPLKSVTRQGCPLYSYLFIIVLEVLATAIRQHKEIKGIQIGKEEVKISLFADDMIVCLSNPKNSTKEHLQLINTFSNVAGYKVNSKKSVALLYTKDKRAKEEIKATSPFTIATNSIKYLGVILAKQVKDLYDENFNTLKKEMEEDLRKWKDLPCSWYDVTVEYFDVIMYYEDVLMECYGSIVLYYDHYDIMEQYYDVKMEYNDVTVPYCDATKQYNDITVYYCAYTMQYCDVTVKF
ncbi:hypothetical protein STEG23_000768, partial [Scotinomys teguina]